MEPKIWIINVAFFFKKKIFKKKKGVLVGQTQITIIIDYYLHNMEIGWDVQREKQVRTHHENLPTFNCQWHSPRNNHLPLLYVMLGKQKKSFTPLF